ncbi:alkyldihydroxyacetonephosphate synthase [Micromonospora rhizosphaerae]|uniref:Alkyldihydroxyacetonephosphate synthase n=1 Tax=Micromonospora rhizosphaerae TaxID=568872 RepID=A0A1C6SWC0_9ACTN|nr:FAD-binding oxidoreductase [Micromonospora rhizosphaerae]SCL33800.1 alkyldihydroxyacetonephosphate synthase [Micromonospora rhizosphaerae]
MSRPRSWWGWGWADRALDAEASRRLAARVAAFGLPLDGTLARVPDPAGLGLPEPRLTPPASLAELCRTDPLTRAAHTHGKAYRDVVRNLRGELDHAPDLVAYPRSEADLVALLDWAVADDVAVVPYGGGTSVVGGVECRDRSRPVLSIDLTGLSGVVEVDEISRAARIRAGTLGPELEDQLRPSGLTLRHFPQSFEFSTLGGWLATRAGGHFATGHTHIEDLVAAVRVVTPAGVAGSLRVPGSGAGPSPDRLWLGSEGTLGVITEAWVRVQSRPRFRAAAAVRFEEYADAVAATRDVVQSGLQPANCRLLDRLESMLGAGVRDGSCRLLLGFESADHPVDSALNRAVQLCRARGGHPDAPTREKEMRADAPDAVAEWRDTFVSAPYLRDALARLGAVVETFETACTWAGFDALHAAVIDAVAHAGIAINGSPALVTCRFTHVYPDGPAPYFTVYAAGRRGAEVAIWDQIKVAASEAIVANGGTITHHHAVGRDHRPWYDRQRPDPFALALRATKRALDPAGVLNPGVLVD